MKIKDTNNIPKYKRILDELFSYKIQIGIFGNSGNYKDGTSILLIANVNEFGCQIKVTEKMRNYLRAVGLPLRNDTEYINIPERSFIRSGFDSKQKDIESRSISLLKKVLLMELDVHTYYDLLGDYIAGQLKDYMTDIDSPPNHPYTIKSKGSSNPLIDSERLIQSITHRVVKA